MLSHHEKVTKLIVRSGMLGYRKDPSSWRGTKRDKNTEPAFHPWTGHIAVWTLVLKTISQDTLCKLRGVILIHLLLFFLKELSADSLF